ncbi:transport protein Avl9-domain-containing protein [Cantharellus anzutake]|uniref:transport protein Avl9-domain-containing protein n=1 Tax=Cantharellus anzutake TaxID=1750568 RepID=UPI001903A2FF|nr:transport protein Avl9-domain-containing protein [Cantharellus anzutake]KAF8340671.1 transport protein Avl9-domain-containing protein [Cantharellus anzutake]
MDDDNFSTSDNETVSQQSVDIPLSPSSSHPALPPSDTARGQIGSPSSGLTSNSDFQLKSLPAGPTSIESSASNGRVKLRQQSIGALGTSHDPSPPPAAFNASPSTSPKSFGFLTRSTTRASTSESTLSSTSTSSIAKKLRPESLIIDPKVPKLIIGLAVVDFNHLVGPTIEIAYPQSILEDEELCKILPFLALPDGAHLNEEDYSYFHVVPTKQTVFPSQPAPPAPACTIFAISCNRQIATSTLLCKEADVTRSTVQKAVVVLASKPLFGMIRDKLGVITRAFFNQRDFRDHSILMEFCDGLESSLRQQLTESSVYMGTRELVHTFRHRTLMLLKLLLIQRKILFFGHPVERLCTYQYSLVSLIPGLLLALEDCGSPSLHSRAATLERAMEFKSSDRKSVLRFLGLPLEIFGKDAFFQPYLPLQQIDLMKTDSFLCGTTNSIMTHQKETFPDLLVNIETNSFDFANPMIERLVSLTAADRKWMDDIVQDVNEGWNEADPQRSSTMQFKGSDDYLRIKFEDYICSALSCLKYTDYLEKNAKGNITVSGATGDPNVVRNFGEGWLEAFQKSHAFQVWDGITDPVIFDIVEPRHPCDTKPSVISDFGLRISEGIHELNLEKNLGSTKEAISSAINAGSTSFFKAVEGVRSEVSARFSAQRAATIPSTSVSPALSPSLPPIERRSSANSLAPPQQSGGGLRPLSLGLGLRRTSSPALDTKEPFASPSTPTLVDTAQAARAAISNWGTGIGSFISNRTAGLRNATTKEASSTSPSPSGTLRSLSLNANSAVLSDAASRSPNRRHFDRQLSSSPVPVSPTLQARDLDKEREGAMRAKSSVG